MFSKAEFAKYFRVGDIIESGSAVARKNAAHLKILAIDDDFIRYQSINNKEKSRVRYPYLGLIIEAFPLTASLKHFASGLPRISL